MLKDLWYYFLIDDENEYKYNIEIFFPNGFQEVFQIHRKLPIELSEYLIQYQTTKRRIYFVKAKELMESIKANKADYYSELHHVV